MIMWITPVMGGLSKSSSYFGGGVVAGGLADLLGEVVGVVMEIFFSNVATGAAEPSDCSFVVVDGTSVHFRSDDCGIGGVIGMGDSSLVVCGGCPGHAIFGFFCIRTVPGMVV